MLLLPRKFSRRACWHYCHSLQYPVATVVFVVNEFNFNIILLCVGLEMFSSVGVGAPRSEGYFYWRQPISKQDSVKRVSTKESTYNISCLLKNVGACFGGP
jgi:hypothetical protein